MENNNSSALEQGYLSCRTCHKLMQMTEQKSLQCPRCHTIIHPRIPNSITQTWALLITGMILFIPANILPVMSLTKGGVVRTDTIMSGILNLYRIDMGPIATIVFIASIAVPLFKIITLAFILLSVQLEWRISTVMRLRMYQLIEFIGRWSMLDILVISILLAIVKFNNIASVVVEPAALVFTGVVIVTMFAAMRFDSRLIWDNADEHS